MPRLDLLRLYDQSVMDWMEGEDRLQVYPVVEKGVTPVLLDVPVVFATPQRSEGGIRRADFRGDAADKATYPYFSVARVGWAYAWQRRNTTHIHRIIHSESKKSVAQARFPFPIDLYYQIDFWARLRTHGNLAMLWLAEQFPYEGGEGRIFTIDFHIPWGKKWIRGFIQDIQDLSDLESGEDEREIRITCKFKMPGHLFQCYESIDDLTYDPTKITYRVPTILSTFVELVTEEQPDVVLDTIAIPEEGQFLPDESYP